MTAYRDDLVNEVLRNLSAPVEIIGALLTNATNSDTTLVITSNDLDDVKPGVFEVESELVYVQTVDAKAGLLSGVIRGYLGTTAASHTAGNVVRLNPATPRVNVIRALNDTLDSLYPRLYGVAEQETAYTNMVYAYDIPATAVNVLAVALQEPDIASAYCQSRRWSFVTNATSESVTGKQVFVADAWVGSTIHVTYAIAPTSFSEASGVNESYATATGLPEWTRNVVTLGASYRLANFMETPPPVVVGDQLQPSQSPAKWATQLYAMFNEALTVAELRLRAQYDVGTIHYQW